MRSLSEVLAESRVECRLLARSPKLSSTAISRAPIVFFDEPLVGLDDANARAVSEALDRLAEGRTTFLITHRLSQIRRADRILVLHQGEIVAQGSHEELLRESPVYRRIFARYAE